ncbi:MAG: hypothetical protein WCK42_08495 [Myxococcaceae bacterium]
MNEKKMSPVLFVLITTFAFQAMAQKNGFFFPNNGNPAPAAPAPGANATINGLPAIVQEIPEEVVHAVTANAVAQGTYIETHNGALGYIQTQTPNGIAHHLIVREDDEELFERVDGDLPRIDVGVLVVVFIHQVAAWGGQTIERTVDRAVFEAWLRGVPR